MQPCYTINEHQKNKIMNNYNNKNHSSGIHGFSAYNPRGMHISWPEGSSYKKQTKVKATSNISTTGIKNLVIKVKKYFATVG
jgi:hypothetical protein